MKDVEYVGKIIKSILLSSRGRYEGAEGTITFTDGTTLEVDDETQIDTENID